jgi:hypothetical protein
VAITVGAGVAARRPIHRVSDTCVISSRAAARVMFGDVASATIRRVAFSISSSDPAACSKTPIGLKQGEIDQLHARFSLLGSVLAEMLRSSSLWHSLTFIGAPD